MKEQTVLKIREARVISGWTDNDDDEGHPASEATLFVQATGIHHMKIGELLQSAPDTAAERDRLREALRQIQNNAAARKWNSESVDRLDMDAWTAIEAKAKAALVGSPDPDPAQRVRDAAPELLAQLQALTVQIEAAGLIVPPKVRAAISSAMGELKS